MTLADRLRSYCLGDQLYHPLICTEAADEIERLRKHVMRHDAEVARLNAEIERLRARIADLEDQLLQALGERPMRRDGI